MSPSETLEKEVQRFRAWANEYPPERRSGEWEEEYPNWGDLYEACAGFLATPLDTWTASSMSTLLYAMARDNESEVLVEQASPDQILLLSGAALDSDERDAKWQLAARLAEIPRHSEIDRLLLRFAEDEDEYVRRRALEALAEIGSPVTETLARRAWDTGEEYQRMACLHALHAIRSPLLDEFLARADSDGRRNLVYLAQRIRNREGDYGK